MSKFGWDLPPGCTQRHIDEAAGVDSVTPLQEQILGLLEDAGIPTHINDAIMLLLLQGETEKMNKEDAEMIDALIKELDEDKAHSEGE